MEEISGIVLGVGAFFAAALIISVIVAAPTMLLINWLFTPSFLLVVFGVSKLGFLKTWALMFICTVLLKSAPNQSK